jgi:hypothetical protein
MNVTALWLTREHREDQPGKLTVLFEVDGQWHTAIEETDDGPISHIIEEAGMEGAPVLPSELKSAAVSRIMDEQTSRQPPSQATHALTTPSPPPVHWCCVVSHGSLKPADVFYAFDQTADAKAFKPFDRQTATELADNINTFTQTSGHAWAMPLKLAPQPGV